MPSDPDKSIPAIPTRYRGVQFRSRLEARWAAFFDLCGWPWEYEPIDLKGYIPDFVLSFNDPILVEVKPALIYDTLHEHERKIEISGWQGHAIIVGAKIFNGDDVAQFEPNAFGGLAAVSGAFGPIRFKGEDDWDIAWKFNCYSCFEMSIQDLAGSCLFCHGGGRPDQCTDRALEFWREAGNRTQWNSPNGGGYSR